MCSKANDRRNLVCYTSEKTSGWICSWITKDRCRRRGHGNISPIPKIATCLLKHISLIKAGGRWRKRLIVVDILKQVETLSTHNWVSKCWTRISDSSARMHAPQISSLQRHTHSCDQAQKHLYSWQKYGFFHLWSCPCRCWPASPVWLLQPCQRLLKGEQGRVCTPELSTLILGLYRASQTQPKSLSATVKTQPKPPTATWSCYQHEQLQQCEPIVYRDFDITL